MKTSNIYIIGIACLFIGFGAAWLFKPASNDNRDDLSGHVSTNKEQNKEEIWTCSMHPQIRRNEPGDCPICGMDLIPANQSGGDQTFGFQMTPEAIKLANIQTTTIGDLAGSGGHTMMLNGRIKADETQASSLVSHIPGRIEKLFVSFTGEHVNQGQKIARIYSPDLITAQKELLEAKKILDINPELLEATKSKLRYWKISSQTIDSILQSGKIQETFNIYAEHSGVVSQRRVAVGDYLSTGEVLFDIYSLKNVWAVFEIYERDIAKVRLGTNINFSTPSLSNKTFTARINFIDPIINSKTRVAAVRAEINNSNGQLKPEMFITGSLNSKQTSSKPIVPKTSVLWTGPRSVVYVKLPNTDIPSFEYREVELGDPLENGYEIISGIVLGDEVVTNGAFVIDAAAQLNNQTSMMNKNVMIKNADHLAHLPDYTAVSPIEFKNQISQVAQAYLLLKDALVNGKVEEAGSYSQSLLIALEEVNMTLVKGEAHSYWMAQMKAMMSHGEQIGKSGDLEEQRKQFDFLSQALIKTIKVFGVEADTFYVQHCPMAFDDNGADWLSAEANIRNPYFGDKMMTCGIVKDTLDRNFKNPTMQMQNNKPQQGHNH